MRRALTSAAVAVALSAAAFGQSGVRRPGPGRAEHELIAMSRAFVDEAIVKEVVLVTGGMTLTPTGLMGVAEVKGRWDSVELEAPAVRLRGDKALVSGRVVFRGHSPDGRALTETSPVRISFVREGRGWKYAEGCLGECGSR
jgi:hypothetical protein